jgi:hypothetical protein
MAYGIGIPRQVAMSSPKLADQYAREALRAIRQVRAAFAPYLSPMDKFRLELDEIWPGGVRVDGFNGQNGLIGLVRIMKPEFLMEGIGGRHGVCHVDAGIDSPRLSSNIYLRVPKSGGELRIWPLKLDAKTARSPYYTLIKAVTFDRHIQEVLHHNLPEPFVIRPQEGDLIIIDSARPHAVAGFQEGSRMSIQSFLTYSDKQLLLSS